MRNSLQRIGSETGRMSRLVDDLLLLARLDSGRPLQRQQLDLTRLAIDSVTDARVSGRDQDTDSQRMAECAEELRLRPIERDRHRAPRTRENVTFYDYPNMKNSSSHCGAINIAKRVVESI